MANSCVGGYTFYSLLLMFGLSMLSLWVYLVFDSTKLYRMEKVYYSVPVLSFQYNQVVLHAEAITSRCVLDSSKANLRGAEKKSFNGYMSRATRYKVKKMLSNWVGAVRSRAAMGVRDSKGISRYITFFTMTLSSVQCHSDQDIKRKILVPFISDLKRLHGLKEYFWRAEAQENGNIHFHMLLDVFVKKEYLQNLWNHHQNTLGYVDIFEKKFGHDAPPSCNVQKLEVVENVEAYVLKYVTKEDGARPIDGRIWGCSDGIKSIKNFSVAYAGDVKEWFNCVVLKEAKKVVQEPMYTWVKCKPIQMMKRDVPWLYRAYLSYLRDIYNSLYFKNLNIKKDGDSKDNQLPVSRPAVSGVGGSQLPIRWVGHLPRRRELAKAKI